MKARGLQLASIMASTVRRLSTGVGGIWFLFALTFARPAAAAGKGQDQALAEALFDQSIALMKAGDYATACPKLVESHRLDPAPGTLLYLGDCYEKTGRLATAWATFREAIALSTSSGEPRRAELARTRAAVLEKRLPYLRAEVSSTTNIKVLTLDGTEIGRALWGSELPVDPGEHTLVASAANLPARTIPFRIDGGEHRTVSIANLEEPPPPVNAPAPTPALKTEVAAPPPSAPPSPPSGSSTGARWQTPAAIGLAGAGLVGLGAGVYFGLTAFSKWGDAEPLCPADRCSPRGITLAEEARSASTMSTVAFAAGSVLLAAGVVLYVLAPKHAATGLSRSWIGGTF